MITSSVTLDTFFKETEHKQRFLTALQENGKIYDGILDPEYAAALYILTADAYAWQLARTYVSHWGIHIKTLLKKGCSSSESVLIKLAGNLLNGVQPCSPVDLTQLNDCDFEIALTALTLRRSRLCVTEVQG